MAKILAWEGRTQGSWLAHRGLTSASSARPETGWSTAGVMPASAETLVSSIPSARLEQEAQILGFRDKRFPARLMGSPQQMQIDGFTKYQMDNVRQKTGRVGTPGDGATSKTLLIPMLPPVHLSSMYQFSCSNTKALKPLRVKSSAIDDYHFATDDAL